MVHFAKGTLKLFIKGMLDCLLIICFLICKLSKFAIKSLGVPLIFFGSLIQTLTLTPPPNNASLVNMDMSQALVLFP